MKKIVFALMGLSFATTAAIANPVTVVVKNKTNCTAYAKIYNLPYSPQAIVVADINAHSASTLPTFDSSSYGPLGYQFVASFSRGQNVTGEHCKESPGYVEITCGGKDCHQIVVHCYPINCPGCKK
jgi:hypothetical protein